MSAQTNHWKLGLFVVLGFVVSLATVVILGARSLEQEVIRYTSYFDESVQGLEVGSPVKFRGVTIGTVAKIAVAPDHRHVAVGYDLAVSTLEDLGIKTPLSQSTRTHAETDLRVQLGTTGITGVKYLLIDFFPVDQYPPPPLPFVPVERTIPVAPSVLKNIEDSMMRTVNRMPELADALLATINRVNAILSEVEDKKLPEHTLATIVHANEVLGHLDAQVKGLQADKLSAEAQKTIAALNVTVARMDRLLASVESDRGLMKSVQRASDAMGDVARNANGLGPEIEETLEDVQEAADAIRNLANTLERDPDMLLKGRARSKP